MKNLNANETNLNEVLNLLNDGEVVRLNSLLQTIELTNPVDNLYFVDYLNNSAKKQISIDFIASLLEEMK